jgi:nicotinamide-nucleotide amidase
VIRVKTAIVIIGDEITSGFKPDVNASFISRELRGAGIGVSRIIAVGDDVGEIVTVLRETARQYDLVVATGGLGPTHDDLTRQAVAEAFGVRLVLDQDVLSYIEERFSKRGMTPPDSIKALALVPEGGRAIANPAGAAPGLAIDHEGTRIYVLPGVPREARAVFTLVLRELDRGADRQYLLSKVLRTVGITESEIAERLSPVASHIPTKLAYLPEETGVDLVLTARSDNEAEAVAALGQAADTILERVGDRVYSVSGGDLHTAVGELLIAARKTIAVAESCTGGLVSHLLTEVPGISACLDLAIVAYSNTAKVEMLGVSGDILERHGAVSGEVAEAMARGIRARAATDLGLSTTGIAGPGGGSEAKPVGLVYMALAWGGGCEVARHMLVGGREGVKRRAAARALDLVRCHLLKGSS